MKKYTLIFVLCSLLFVPVFGQTKLPQVRMLENKGWSVQHSVMSWDSLSIYFAAKAPGMSSYDLYIQHAEGWKWGEPYRCHQYGRG